MQTFKPVALGALCLLAAMGVSADRVWPEKEYSCHVKTATGADGVVGIQTISRERAEKVVVGLTATTMAGREERAASVVQCIEKRTSERFNDPGFRDFVKNLGG